MSTADSFRYHRPFPFCVPAITDNPYYPDDSRLAIVDLTLADAMQLMWNLETVAFSIQAIGGITGGGGAVVLDVFGESVPAATGGPFTPQSRICRYGDFLEEFRECFGFSEQIVSGAYTYPSSTADAIFHDMFFFREIYQQGDGLYTLPFWLDPRSDAGQYYLLGRPDSSEGDYEYTGISGDFDLTDDNPNLSSGHIPFYLYSYTGGDDVEATSANFNLFLTFYT